MKRGPFTILFVAINISFLFLQIYKYSCWNEALYARQECEAKKKALLAQKNALLHKQCMLKDPQAIKQFARQNLGMEPMHIQQVKTLQDSHAQPSAA
jgi:hypothetical protein